MLSLACWVLTAFDKITYGGIGVRRCWDGLSSAAQRSAPMKIKTKVKAGYPGFEQTT